jgi:tetratricopeptide (TPR) repeat protein
MLFAAAAALFAAGCGGDDGGTTPSTSASEYTSQGWTLFEQGDFATALSRFSSAVSTDASYGPAYVGQGWANIMLTNFGSAGTSFDNAVSHGEDGADTYGGRAAAYLGLVTPNYPAAVTAAQTALTQSPGFVFDHRTSFNVNDLHLIEAYALAGQAQYQSAIAAADAIAPSGIVATNPSTWVVDTVSYSTFAQAVLAYLMKMSEQEAG